MCLIFTIRVLESNLMLMAANKLWALSFISYGTVFIFLLLFLSKISIRTYMYNVF